MTEELYEKFKKLDKIAKGRGETLSQTALAWVLAHEGITSVLIGASSPKQILENVKVTESAPFTQEEMDIIEAL